MHLRVVILSEVAAFFSSDRFSVGAVTKSKNPSSAQPYLEERRHTLTQPRRIR